MESFLSQDVIKIFFLGLSLIIPVLAFSYFQRRRDRERYDLELRMKREELKLSEYNLYQSTKLSERDERYGMKYIEELMYRFDRLEKKMSSRRSIKLEPEIDEKINYIVEKISHTNQMKVESKADKDTSDQFIKEISHALNTPLSQIEVAASLALASDKHDGLMESAQSIVNSVQICKAFLGAYRELILTSSASVWNPTSFSQAVESAGNIYMAKLKKNVALNVDLPDDVDGYSNNYLTALILPILENAIESSIENSCVIVSYENKNDNLVLNIKNDTNEKIVGVEIFNSGFTTKKEHEGLGLSSVKSLLSAIRGADLEYQVEDSSVTFNILLPRKAL